MASPRSLHTERESDYSSTSSSSEDISDLAALTNPPCLPLPPSLSASSSSIATASLGTEMEEELSLHFGPTEPIHCWKKLSSCEEFVGAKRSKHTIVAWNDKVYVFGGDNGRRMLNDFLVSSIRDSSWARVVFTGERRGVCGCGCTWEGEGCVGGRSENEILDSL